jgi:hypothetical protein
MTTPSFGGLNVNPMLEEPAGVTGRTMPRGLSTLGLTALTSGTPVFRVVPLPAALPVNSIGICTGTTAEAGGTHAWAALLAPGGQVVTVSADNTGAAFLPASTYVPIPVLAQGQQYVTPYAGLYIVQVCVVAATPPNLQGAGSIGTALNGVPPFLCGTTAAGQTTPPALGSVQVLTANTGGVSNFYATIT